MRRRARRCGSKGIAGPSRFFRIARYAAACRRSVACLHHALTQICNVTSLSSIMISFVRKSAPIVALYCTRGSKQERK